MTSVLKVVQFLCGLALIVAIVFSWLWALPFANRVAIYRERHKYRPETFLVRDAVYERGGEFGPTWWLAGTVAGREERLVPDLEGVSPSSANELLARHPRGSMIDVFYNSDATDTLVQGELLRVLEAEPNLWQKEATRCRQLALRVLLPVPVALAAYLAARYAIHRRDR